VTDRDTELFLQINAFARATGWLHPLMTAWADYGIAAFALLLVLAWWQSRRRDDPAAMAAALWAPLATVLAVAVNQPLVHLAAEPRPYSALPGILVLAHQRNDPSFPSDHAVMAGAVAIAVFTVDRRLGAVAAIAAALLGFSRVYIAAHYPADVLVGLGLGTSVAACGWVLLRRTMTAVVVRLAASRWRGLVTATPSLTAVP
jgi:undecaprenyl-diphosphatase